MIPVQELRSGSYVKANGLHNGKILSVKNWIYDSVDIIVFFKESDTGEYLKDIEPIPLTDDILLKCGFEKMGTIFDYWHKKHDRIRVVLCTDGFYRLMTGMYDFLEDEPNISYLHNFQNTFFFIIGEELIITKF